MSLMQWVNSRGEWQRSRWSLPELPRDADPVVQRWALVAGGLALILSRVSPSEQAARFAWTGQAYALIRHRLRQSRPVNASATLLGEVMHEVADVADPVTRAGLQAFFRDAALRAAEGRVAREEGGWVFPSSLVAASGTSGRSGSGMQGADDNTTFSPDLLKERSQALRNSVAAARTTAFTEFR